MSYNINKELEAIEEKRKKIQWQIKELEAEEKRENELLGRLLFVVLPTLIGLIISLILNNAK